MTHDTRTIASLRNDPTSTITEAQARRLGYTITRGAYANTSDDRIDRWYIEDIDSDVVDRRGSGYPTKAVALAALANIIRYHWYEEQATR